MKITLAKSGGLAAAITRRLPPRIVDAKTLPQPVAAGLARLVEAAKDDPAAKDAKPGPAADAMSYTITVEGDDKPVGVHQAHTTMSTAVAALRTWRHH